MPTKQWQVGRFFEIVEDPDLFRFRGHNFFKIFHNQFLNGQAQEVYPGWQPRARPPRNVRWVASRLLALARASVRAAYLGLRCRLAPRILFFGSAGRYSAIGDTLYDLYNARIVEREGCDRFILMQSIRDPVPKRFAADLVLEDFVALVGFLKLVGRVVLAPGLSDYAESVLTSYPGLGFGQKQITSTMIDFYARFWLWRFLLLVLSPERIFLTVYYDNGPLIAAGRSEGLEIVELMHGTIVDTHPQYNFPKSYSYLYRQGLFPDKIAVYGQYWKEVLTRGNMFPEDAIEVVGYYFKVVDQEQVSRPEGLQSHCVILVSTQPKLQREFYSFVSFLQSQLDNESWHVIIKPHPKEDSSVYAPLLDQGLVTVSDASVYELLAQADIHISVYSSVVHEALRYGVCNYVLLVDSAWELCQAIVESGVALPLRPNQVPEPCMQPSVTVRYYFEEYDHSVLFGE